MKITRFLFLMVVFMFLIPTAYALSLSGDQISPIIYEPGKVIENSYSISETDLEVDVALDGNQDILRYLSLEDLTDDKFNLKIQFPDALTISPGSYPFSLSVTEIQGEGAKLGSLLSVGRQFVVEVYSYEKAIEASLSAPSINQGSDMELSLTVKSRTYSNIDVVNAKISVYDKFGKKMGEVFTESQSLDSLSSISFSVPFGTKNLPLGDYRAEAVINYDSQQKTVDDEFKIGDLDVIIENFTSPVASGFSDFEIQVRNNWGDGVGDVYAQLFIGENMILHTPSINLEAWAVGKLSAIGNFDLSPGEYPAVLKIFFEGEQKEEQITLNIVESENKPLTTSNVLVILLSGVILSIIFLSLMIYIKKGNKKDRI